MGEVLREIKGLQIKEREYMPNLRGTSSVNHDGEGRLYAAQTVSRGRPNQQRRDHDGVPDTTVMTAYVGWVHRQECVSALAGALGRIGRVHGQGARAHEQGMWVCWLGLGACGQGARSPVAERVGASEAGRVRTPRAGRAGALKVVVGAGGCGGSRQQRLRLVWTTVVTGASSCGWWCGGQWWWPRVSVVAAANSVSGSGGSERQWWHWAQATVVGTTAVAVLVAAAQGVRHWRLHRSWCDLCKGRWR